MFNRVLRYLDGKRGNESVIPEEETVEREHFEYVIENYGATEPEALHFLRSEQYENFRKSRFSLSEEADLREAYGEFKDENGPEFVLTGDERHRVSR